MNKIKRGMKVAWMLLSLLAVCVATDSGSLLGQIPTTYSNSAVVMEHSAGCSGCNASTGIVYAQPAPVYTASASSCGCNSGCSTCQKKVACPQCDCQFCELDVKKGEVEKTCFKTEQKEVCIPAVRLPWKKCCPPKRSKVRTVNVLKKHKYKCPQCQYKWNVHEPDDIKTPEPAKKNVFGKATEAQPTEGAETLSIFPDPSAAMGEVPRPPVEN